MAKQLRVEEVQFQDGQINVVCSTGQAPLGPNPVGEQNFGFTGGKEELRTYVESVPEEIRYELMMLLALQPWLKDDPNMVNLGLPVGNTTTINMDSSGQPIVVDS